MKPRKKGGRKPLARGAPRLLGYHGGTDGHLYAAAFAALAEQYGPFTLRLVRMEAGRTAAAWVRFVLAQRALTAARRERERGKGRRPSAQALERLSRRVGLEDASYAQALEKLRALAQRNGDGKPTSGAELLARREPRA